MIDNFFEKVIKINNKILNVIKKGVSYSSFICIIASLVLFYYSFISRNLNLYYLGINLFSVGLIFIVGFVIIGISFDRIYKEMGN